MESPPLAVKNDPRWLAAERVANSRCFQRSSRLRDFLLYIVQCDLRGKAADISEQNIGERVFGRRENYSPLEDNIVRVSARQLRLKLKEFYDAEGRDDPWVIEIPKGGYVPAFHERAAAQEAAALQTPPSVNTPERRLRLQWLVVPLVVVCVLLVAWWGNPIHRSYASQSASSNIVLAIFHQTKDPIQIILSDSALGAMQSMVGHSFSLEEYSSGSYRTLPSDFGDDPHKVAVWNSLSHQQTANLGDFGAAFHLRDALVTLSRQEPVVRSARDMRARDFRSGDFIVLGGAAANPWVHLLEQHPFTFQFEDDSSSSNFVVVNHDPARGEASVYHADNEGHEYARIALVPNLTKSGQTLMIAGMSMESTEAAVDFCLSSDSMKLLTALHVNGAGEVPSFEALLRTRKEDGTGVNAELVAIRPFRSK